jgi:hypothetical protein
MGVLSVFLSALLWQWMIGPTRSSAFPGMGMQEGGFLKASCVVGGRWLFYDEGLKAVITPCWERCCFWLRT